MNKQRAGRMGALVKKRVNSCHGLQLMTQLLSAMMLVTMAKHQQQLLQLCRANSASDLGLAAPHRWVIAMLSLPLMPSICQSRRSEAGHANTRLALPKLGRAFMHVDVS